MKKILILLGLITSLIGAGQALAESADQVITCALVEDAANAGKFASLGYEIVHFELGLAGNEASLSVVHPDGTSRAIGGVGGVGSVHAQDATIFVGWDHNEHWADLRKEGDALNGTITVEEDFAFTVVCQ